MSFMHILPHAVHVVKWERGERKTWTVHLRTEVAANSYAQREREAGAFVTQAVEPYLPPPLPHS